MNIKTGILLAAGSGSRLAPLTTSGGVNKHMLPVYDRFMIDYPLNTLKDLGCERVTIVIGGDQTGFGQIISYLKDGESFGMKFNFIYQPKASGIAHAINLCKDFIKDERFAVILADNVFDKKVNFTASSGAQIVLCQHEEIHRFGVASIQNGKIIDLKEKPKEIDELVDNFAVTGLYLFDNKFFDYFQNTIPSARNEYEIVDILNQYKQDDSLNYVLCNAFWSDTGTFDSILKVSNRLREKSFKK